MKEELISFETAKLAKEEGFNEPCKNFYGSSEDEIYDDYGQNEYFKNWVTAPTQSLLAKWLREEHDILVLIDTDWFSLTWKVLIPDHELPQKIVSDNTYNTYEEALEKGLQEALKLI